MDIGNNPAVIIAGCAFILTLIVQAVAVFRYIAGIKDGLQQQVIAARDGLQNQLILVDKGASEKIVSAEKSSGEKIESIRREAELRVEKLAESESKSRHDLAGQVQSVVGDLRRDMKTLEANVNSVQRDMIRRVDLSEIETRIMTAMERSEKTRGEWFDKIEKRMNFIAERRQSVREKD